MTKRELATVRRGETARNGAARESATMRREPATVRREPATVRRDSPRWRLQWRKPFSHGAAKRRRRHAGGNKVSSSSLPPPLSSPPSALSPLPISPFLDWSNHLSLSK
ncbi:hypothetical protein LR48_Vigan07g209000 [Vigna angularis]|uniref:Uncharacterized protein n=1 Tax=Phaseolus angularis TaxID=3914 RepID=A0A0L9V0A1_PHAAN|nr:hypothetical protein LR48_Vigan07g209000 [Vigna angularis]